VKKLTPEARALAQALLDHHKQVSSLESDQKRNLDSCLIAEFLISTQQSEHFYGRSQSGATTTAGRRSTLWPSIMKRGHLAMDMTMLRVAA